jgi:hypothetical protein
MPQPPPSQKGIPAGSKPVTSDDYRFLASLLEGRGLQRIQKKDPYGQALLATGDLYEEREYAAAYDSFKPVYDKIAADMQRVLTRNLEFAANKLAKERQMPLAAAKENVQKMKTYAQQVIDQLDRLLRDLESKPMVRIHLKQRASEAPAESAPEEESPPTTASGTNETRVDAAALPASEILSDGRRYAKAPYSPPETGALYSVRDKVKGDRIIRIIGKRPDGAVVQVEVISNGVPSKHPIELAVDALASQAVKGWCCLLIPVDETQEARGAAIQPRESDASPNAIMRLDIQNFGRCCADINRAHIKFDTQLIKDVGDGPFRAGHYEQAFLTFEQFAMGFTSAVASSRRGIADGRRALNSEKGSLSGKEIQERTAAFVRHEQLISTAEREFSKILEGLRTYLRAKTQSPTLSTS